MFVTLACSALLCLQGEAGKPVDGQVLTSSGKTADDLEVFFSPNFFQQPDGVIPIFGRTTTDLGGRFHFDAPDLTKFRTVAHPISAYQ